MKCSNPIWSILAICSYVLAICSIPANCQIKLPDSPFSSFFGSGMQRTMSLLAGSNPWKHNQVKILVYGQSITAQGYIDRYLKDEFSRLYPDARVSIENRSISGYGAEKLVRTAQQDLYPEYPDLIIFHDYGGTYTGELERIISNVRRYTTSEFMILTHHVDAGDGNWNADCSKVIRELAAKYGCEVADMWADWEAYIKQENLDPKALLADSVHPNDRGGNLMARLAARHFVQNPYIARSWENTVRTYEARRGVEEAPDEICFSGSPWKVETSGTVGADSKSALLLKFTGNRVDIVSQVINGKPGSAKILIDGKAPSSFPSVWAATRANSLYEFWFPSVSRITLGGKPIAEDWTLYAKIKSDDGRDFTFETVGSVTGKDGEGNGKQPFISKSGIIHILPMDFASSGVNEWLDVPYRKFPLPKEMQYKWSVYCMGTDVFKPILSTEQGAINQTIIVKGLPNGNHELKIIPIGDGPVPVKEIIVHNPPMSGF